MNPVDKLEFGALRRQEFRTYFQPSRVVIGVVPAPTESGLNAITLCFSMYCSYKPPMMAIAIQDCNESHSLIQRTDEYVLAVPGESMFRETMVCGRESVRDVDKVKTLGLELIESRKVRVPGLKRAIANIELVKRATIETGDHILVVGEVMRFGVNRMIREQPLLSVGSNTAGYRVLAHEGIHRLAVVQD